VQSTEALRLEPLCLGQIALDERDPREGAQIERDASLVPTLPVDREAFLDARPGRGGVALVERDGAKIRQRLGEVLAVALNPPDLDRLLEQLERAVVVALVSGDGGEAVERVAHAARIPERPEERCWRRCSPSRPTASRTARACRTRCASP
jgi:hypothetical protein